MKCPNCDHVNLPGSDQCEACHQDLTQFDETVARDRVEQSLLEDPVSSIKPKTPVVVRGDVTVRDAVGIMLSHNIGAVLIVDESEQLAGIFTERDLLTKVAHETNPALDRPLSELMTTKLDTVTEDNKLAYVLHQMDVGGYRHVPVVREGEPIGVVSVRDMLAHVTQLCGH